MEKIAEILNPIQNLPPTVISTEYNTFIKFNEREKSVFGKLRC